ncbi:MAG: porin [Nannocystis sp.]|nr:porin [Nannocystis sp.]MBA3548543.1 porin [Nannocystis sp.]
MLQAALLVMLNTAPDAAPAPPDELIASPRPYIGPTALTVAPSAVPSPRVSPAPQPASPPAPSPVAVAPPPAELAPAKKADEPWYERIKIRGYTQVRYNRLPSGRRNDELINEQGDKSIGAGNGFIIRRARLVLYGDVHPRVSIYLQPDFASAIGDQLGVAIVRDWYADIYFDKKKEFRVRVGQSKVPFGFENMQSSQNRLALDRNDALNSAVKDERDLGVFLYWAPDRIRKRFADLVSSNLKGSGDYGVVGLGVYNGQTANRPELNNNLHAIARVTWPFAIRNQILEIGGGGFYGKATVKLAEQSDGTTYTTSSPTNTLTDARGHASVILYPKPFGITAEYNMGVGPAQGRLDPTVIKSRFLKGGYVLLSYKIDKPFKKLVIFPYVRATMYDGGKKFFPNAPLYKIREIEAGLEFQPIKWVEIVLAYMVADRTSDRYPYNQEYGHVTRIQVQVNY